MLSVGGNVMSVASQKRKAAQVELDMSQAGESLWLCKVPEFLGEKLARANHDEVVGKFRISVKSGGPGKPKVKTTTVHIGEREELVVNEEEVAIPKDYTLEDTAVGDDVKMITFSKGGGSRDQSSSSSSVGIPPSRTYKLNGKITKSMTLRPDGQQYARLLRDRNMRSHDRKQTVASNNESAILNIHGDRSKALIDFQAPLAAEMRKKAREADLANKGTVRYSSSKVAQEQMDGLRDKLLLAFAKTERLKQVDIQAFCHDVPGYTSQRVKELLEDYCKYYQKGTYKHFWELKPEYRDNLEPPEQTEQKET